jgi:hypothetical protein
MILYFHVPSQQLFDTALEPFSTLDLPILSALEVRLRFLDSTWTRIDPEPTGMALTVKAAGNFTQDPPYALADTWAKVGTTTAEIEYVTVFATLTSTVNAALTTAATATLSTIVDLRYAVDGVETISPVTAGELLRPVYDSGATPPAPTATTQIRTDITQRTGGTANALDSIATVPLGLGSIIGFVGTAGLEWWQLNAGTQATSNSYTRPVDYNASTNARVWKRAA